MIFDFDVAIKVENDGRREFIHKNPSGLAENLLFYDHNWMNLIDTLIAPNQLRGVKSVE